jgi:hypothetical protein
MRQEIGIRILREVVGRCEAAHLPLLPVKGVVTARTLYRDVADRTMGDVDIRIRPGDVTKFQQVAGQSGWQSVRVLRAYGNLIYDFGSLSLDVESYVGPPGLCGLTVEAMLARSERLEMAPGLEVRVPELHDHALLLAVNVFKDKLVTSAPWAICDLERVVLAPNFRPEVFVERAINSRVATLAWIVAGWMQEARESDAWGAIGRAIESRARVRRAYASWFRRRLRTTSMAPTLLRVGARAAADSWAMRAHAVARAALAVAEMRARALCG